MKVHSALHGVRNNLKAAQSCLKFESYKVWKVFDFGFYLWPNQSVLIKDSIVADNKISVFANVAGPNVIKHQYADHKITFENMLFVGQTNNFDCAKDNQAPFNAAFHNNDRSPRAAEGENFFYFVELSKKVIKSSFDFERIQLVAPIEFLRCL